MLSAKLAIDIIFIGLVVVAILITAIVVAKAMTDKFSIYTNSAQQAQTNNNDNNLEESGDTKVRPTLPHLDAQPKQDQSFELSITDAQTATASPTDQIAASIYGSSPIILPITWGTVAGTLIWRGKVRSTWSKQGYDYDTFKLLTRMRGSPMRIRLLNAINSSPKNKLQLAKELDVDWKTIDNHIEMLLHSRLVEERTVVGTARYYAITHDGIKVLSLLSNSSEMTDSEN
ncbi:MAG: winged helix-turn-helix domain-containing protein [Nitrososphaera sp.]|uniref:ArnR1-like winged helix-turn-helix domain-containing protein n=1 Tax=Nitrososphaera gargensis (strain Ga9.2) TaxID=1237085 RepID=K0IND3_NITGG|nr:winged helix-turn-helix domain-containing protein [Candidatus Nitrososphaera gargensis]AFU59174.1 hypothetical protein Ngar_c22440 [Candidatus Nitrososphaera gargensis Ga9.2]